MNRCASLSHTRWECKYHIVFVPKCRRKELYGKIKYYLGKLFHELAKQRESQIEVGHICTDHVHMCISIPPKFSVSQVVGYIKGKSAIYIAREFQGKKRSFYGQSFWARGYYVSTVGRDEETIKEYIRNQSAHDAQMEQLKIQS